MSSKTYNVVDLFSGCGGTTKGLIDAGLNVVAGIDIWDTAVSSYSKNFDHSSYLIVFLYTHQSVTFLALLYRLINF